MSEESNPTFIIDNYSISHRDAKYIITHINKVYGHCNSCNFDKINEEYINCPKCETLNINWQTENEYQIQTLAGI